MHKTDAWQMGKLQEKEKKISYRVLNMNVLFCICFLTGILLDGARALTFKHGGVPNPPLHTHSPK